jgi:hypothetical protein
VVSQLHVPDGRVGDAMLVEATLPGLELLSRGYYSEVVEPSTELGEGSTMRPSCLSSVNAKPVPGCMQVRP